MAVRLQAHSEGAGKGAEFTVRLPHNRGDARGPAALTGAKDLGGRRQS